MNIEKITYAGHSAVFFHCGDLVVAIDPWLEGNPRCPANLKTPTKLDLIILTHGHSDHAGDTLRLAKEVGAKVAATYELAVILNSEGVPQEKLIMMNKGGSVTFRNLRISLTHAFHSSSYETAGGTVYAGEPCGVVLSDSKHSVYHAGDTALFSDMQLINKLYSPQLVFLPVGDTFTMGPREAQLALKYLRPKAAVPIHYKTFDALTGTAEELIDLCAADPETKHIKIHALEPGQSLSLTQL